MQKINILLVILLFSIPAFAQEITEGSLFASGRKGKELGACPLKHTDVKTEISGFLARVKVTQEFENNFNEPIEAIYTFPLSQNSAVDDMTMKIGERTIRGRIMKREEAKKIYETAKTEGKTASLLDQERPNIFTQSVANILPNEKIIIEISYVETLKYEDGSYEFVFPMTVGQRYIPASVIDAKKVSPPVALTRAGHDISIEVSLDAGVPVEEIRCNSHEIQTTNLSTNSANIKLKDETAIPNKDFVLRYDVAGKRIEDAVLTHRDDRGGFFTLIMQPPNKFTTEDVTPKEIVFVLDTSGSMEGFPIEKAKEAMKMSLEGLYPYDTFNLITFAGDTSILFDKPVPATQANLEKAQAFLESRQGSGGTEMMKAIKAALEPTDEQDHIRIVCFMTDGYVGNESEIISEIQKHPKARVFSFGIGSSVNRYLLDKMAGEGLGEVEYVSLKDDGSKAAKKFYERVRSPLLTDISVDWGDLPVADIYPNKISDLFSAKPVILHGRYTKGITGGTIKLKGKVAGQDYVREILVNFPESESKNDSLATLWARSRIDDLTSKSLKSEASLDLKNQTQNDIIQLGLEYNLLTQFTSFIAVEEKIRTAGGKSKTIEVPVEPAEGSFGDKTGEISKIYKNWSEKNGLYITAKPKTKVSSGSGMGIGTGSGSGSGVSSGYSVGRVNGNVSYGVVNGAGSSSDVPPPKAISGGVVNGKAINLARPVYPPAAKAVKASGAVNIRILIDEAGSVISAYAISGLPLLRGGAEKAALASKFTPFFIDGKSVKATGVIVYNFIDPVSYPIISPGEMSTDEKDIALVKDEAEKLEKAAKIRQRLAEKLHSRIFALVMRLQKGETVPDAGEAKFVKEGKAEVQIWLTEKTSKNIEDLKALGFEVLEDKKAKVITGKIAIEKLADLVEIVEVQYILPSEK